MYQLRVVEPHPWQTRYFVVEPNTLECLGSTTDRAEAERMLRSANLARLRELRRRRGDLRAACRVLARACRLPHI